MSAESLRELFDRAREMPTAARVRLLAELEASSNPEVGELRRLLDAANAGDSPLDAGPWKRLAAESLEPEAPQPERIGAYRILRELGRGGMGRVYLAEQEGEGFRRQVALKVVQPGGVGAEVERRFRDERRILAGLEHSGIARFYDAGRSSDGRWFLALEYVEGQNLLDHARMKELATAERLQLFLAVLDAVEFAHARSVVHRDLKPDNILVGADGRPRLLDFGIAKLLDPEIGADAIETRPEYRAFTPAYASPEQFRGDRVTASSDVFSLGIVLYELLSGVRPFSIATSSRAAIERAVLAEEPAAPSAARSRAARLATDQDAGAEPRKGSPRLRRTDGGLDRDLDEICLKALRKQPGERYRSAGAFAADLRCYLDGRPVEARRGGRRYRFARFALRHRGRLALATALTLAAVAIGVAVTAQRAADRLRSPEMPEPRPFPFSDVGSIPIDELERRFIANPEDVAAGAALTLALSGKGRTQEAQLVLGRLRQIPGKEQDPLTDYADAMLAMALGEPQRALVLHTRARDGALAGGRGELLAQARAARGTQLAMMGEIEAARAEMRLARADFERAGDHASLARVLGDLAVGYLQRGELARGEKLLEAGLAAARRAGKEPVPMLWGLGQLAMQRGRPDLAEPRMRGVLEAIRKSGNRRREPGAVRDLSEILRDLGRADEADALLAESIALLRTTENRADLAAALYYRGVAEIERGRLDSIAMTVVEVEEAASTGLDKRGLGLAHHLRGRTAAAQGRSESARGHFAEGSRFLVDSGDLDLAAEMDLYWARAEHDGGDSKTAFEVLDRALERLGGGKETLAFFFSEAQKARMEAEAGRTVESRHRLVALGDEASESPSVRRRISYRAASGALASAEGRFEAGRADLAAAIETASASARVLDSLDLRLELAGLELRAGEPERAQRGAALVAGEAERLRLPALAARAEARRLAAKRSAPLPAR